MNAVMSEGNRNFRLRSVAEIDFSTCSGAQWFHRYPYRTDSVEQTAFRYCCSETRTP